MMRNGKPTHMMATTPTFRAWTHMWTRVRNPNFNGYKYYGGRGITVCERWRSFENFLADMGERPLGPTWFSLDRIDNDGNYGPDNCRWATRKQQSQNRRPYVYTPEGLAKMSKKGLKFGPRSDEAKAKMRAAAILREARKKERANAPKI